MRRTVLPSPSEEELRTSPAYEVVRDFPELLPLLRKLGVDPGEGGLRTLHDLLSGSGPWVSELMACLAWRDLERSSPGSRFWTTPG